MDVGEYVHADDHVVFGLCSGEADGVDRDPEEVGGIGVESYEADDCTEQVGGLGDPLGGSHRCGEVRVGPEPLDNSWSYRAYLGAGVDQRSKRLWVLAVGSGDEDSDAYQDLVVPRGDADCRHRSVE